MMKARPERLLEVTVARAKLEEEITDLLRREHEIRRLRVYHSNGVNRKIKRKIEVKLHKMERSTKRMEYHIVLRYDKVRSANIYFLDYTPYPMGSVIVQQRREEDAIERNKSEQAVHSERVPDVGELDKQSV